MVTAVRSTFVQTQPLRTGSPQPTFFNNLLKHAGSYQTVRDMSHKLTASEGALGELHPSPAPAPTVLVFQ